MWHADTRRVLLAEVIVVRLRVRPQRIKPRRPNRVVIRQADSCSTGAVGTGTLPGIEDRVHHRCDANRPQPLNRAIPLADPVRNIPNPPAVEAAIRWDASEQRCLP